MMLASTASSLCVRFHPQNLLGAPVSRSFGSLVRHYLLSMSKGCHVAIHRISADHISD